MLTGQNSNSPRGIDEIRLFAVWMSALAPTCLVLRLTIRCIICVFAMLAAITLSRINQAFAASMAALAEMPGRQNMLRHDWLSSSKCCVRKPPIPFRRRVAPDQACCHMQRLRKHTPRIGSTTGPRLRHHASVRFQAVLDAPGRCSYSPLRNPDALCDAVHTAKDFRCSFSPCLERPRPRVHQVAWLSAALHARVREALDAARPSRRECH
jgi:hypothetical protein